MNTQELWRAALGELELSLSKANFTTWFKQTFIISYQSGEVTLGVPNAFTKTWLEKKYHKPILNALQNLCQEPIRYITYKVETSQRAPEPVVTMQQAAAAPQPMTVTLSVGAAPRASLSIAPPLAATSSGTSEYQGLNPKYTFVNFIVGKGSELAHAAAQAVAQHPGTAYNPLFLYGGVGLGKTHLLQAIGHDLMQKNPATRVLYVTCERFTNDFINAVRTGRAKDFKDLYRNVDLLLIDDVQFIAGKKETQEEFFHTFNALHQQNKQIVMTSDKPPRAIPDLEDRLKSRFECGMLADILSPDLETRVAILQTKCREKGYQLQHEILIEVAKVVQSNVRELEGALNKVFAHHQLQNLTPSVDSVRPLLSSFNSLSAQKFVSSRLLIETVATYYDIRIEELMGQSREKRLAFPRQIAMYLMREELKYSFPAIGQELGGRDHTTAMHACDKIRKELDANDRLQQDLESILQQVRAK